MIRSLLSVNVTKPMCVGRCSPWRYICRPWCVLGVDLFHSSQFGVQYEENTAEEPAINYFPRNRLWLNTAILHYIIILSCVYPVTTCQYGCHEKGLLGIFVDSGICDYNWLKCKIYLHSFLTTWKRIYMETVQYAKLIELVSSSFECYIIFVCYFQHAVIWYYLLNTCIIYCLKWYKHHILTSATNWSPLLSFWRPWHHTGSAREP